MVKIKKDRTYKDRVIKWTPADKILKINQIITKMKEFGFYSEEIPVNELMIHIKKYISDEIEYTGEIKFPLNNKKACCMFRNSIEYEISITFKNLT